MRVAITGATGFLGRNLAFGLLEDGHEVVASGRSRAVGEALEAAGIEFRAADLRDSEGVARALAGASCVVHCGARSGPWGSYREHFEANVVGTRHTLAACRRLGIERLVFISTPSIYFSRRDRLGVAEDDPLPVRGFNHYATTKRLAEDELRAAAGATLSVIVLRPRALHGPFDTIFTPRIARLAAAPRMPLVAGGRALVDVTYVANCVDAVRRALVAPEEAWNQAYNIANGEPLTVREWFTGQAAALGFEPDVTAVPRALATMRALAAELTARLPFASGPPVMTRASVAYLAHSMTMSITKAHDRLGYVPRIGNAEGFHLTAEWFRSYPEWLRGQPHRSQA